MSKLWTVQDVASYLCVPVKTIYQWRAKGYGPKGKRIGRYVRYAPEDVINWVNSLEDKVA